MFALAATSAADGVAAQVQKQQVAGPYVVELTVNPKPQVTETPMLVTVTDNIGQPVDTAAARGRANFSSGGLKGTATLRPDGANRMKGYGLMSAKPDLRIEVSIFFRGMPELRVLFMPARNETGEGRPNPPKP